MKLSVLVLSAAFGLLFFLNCGAGGGGGSSGGGGGGGGPGPGSGATSQVITVTSEIVFSGSQFDRPNYVAADAVGNIWVTDGNASGKGVIKIYTDGLPDCSAGTCVSITAQGLGSSNLAGLAIDGAGDVWLKSGLVYKISNAGAIVSAGPNGWGSGNGFSGDYRGAIDSSGNFWFGNSAGVNGNVPVMSNAGAVLNTGYTATGLWNTMSVAIDGEDNVWVANITTSNTGFVIKFPAATPLSPVSYTGGGIVSPISVAIDPSGNVWVASNNSGYGTGTTDSVIKIAVGAAADCSSGCTEYTHSYLSTSLFVASDGAGNIWVANGVNGSVTKIAAGAPANCATGCFKYINSELTLARSVAIDPAGNVWIANSGDVVGFPLIAAPTTAPIASQSRGAAPGKFWAKQPAGIGHSMNGIVYSGSLWVAVGSGDIIASTDNFTWTSRTNPTLNALNGVTYGNSQFVAVGQAGTILTSPDGITWTQRTSGIATYLRGVAWSGSLYMAVGDSAVLTSPDGITWTVRTPPTSGYTGVTWSGTNFVAVTTAPGVDVSADGISWASASSIPSTCSCYLHSVATNGTRLVAVGGSSTSGTLMVTSTDAGHTTWTAITPPVFSVQQALVSVAWTGSQFVAVGYFGNAATSPDGVTWTARNTGGGLGSDSLYAVAGTSLQLVAAGPGSFVRTSP